MSLFPAYSNEISQPNTTANATTQPFDWLENSSFQQVTVDNNQAVVDEAPPTESEQKAPEPPKKKKIDKSRRKISKKDQISDEEEVRPSSSRTNDDFQIDTTRNREFLNMKFLSRAPRYFIRHYCTGDSDYRRRKGKRFKRYYQCRRIDPDDNRSDNDVVITKSTINSAEFSKKDEHFTGFKQEGQLSESTAHYNKSLGQDPNNIKMWLEYVRFQDTVYQFEKTYRKGSIAKGLRVMAERKLSILDKALSFNANCEELLRERLNIAVSVYPSDELQVHLRNLVDKDQGNIILWQGYIEATQCSMSHCNTPAVLKLYVKCLSTLHNIRRNVTIEKTILEENILRMLYQCGLFLKQAGLFEQLWTLLRLYLELNLSSNDQTKFNISSGFDENQLIELEEVVFKSQLPLHELWLRTEKLRESCHWLPYIGHDDATCDDPQRLVFTEDVAELIHPITRPENIFKLIATILNLLKVPLLPCRHVTMQDLGLDYVPWALDSIESLLPIFFPIFPIDLSNRYLIIDSRLAVGPQYLKILPGQEEYLFFLIAIMKSCLDCLTGLDQLALTVWWIRFQKLIVILDGKFKMPANCRKKIKTNIKNLLKQPENRNNVIFYSEYALFERELGNADGCLNILKTTLNSTVKSDVTVADKTAFCHLIRTLVEYYLTDNQQQQQALIHLVDLALERRGLNNNTILTPELLHESQLKFKHATLKLLSENLPKKLSPTDQLLPDFTTDWIICNGWFLFLTQGPIQAGAFIEDILQKLNDNDDDIYWQKEVLFEFYVAVIYKHCLNNPGFGIFKILDDVLHRAVESYPNNLLFLSVLAKVETLGKSCGQSWWKIKKLLVNTGRALPILFLVLIANQQIVYLRETVVDTITGGQYEINNSMKNRMLSLFRLITRADVCTRRCGLIWRLYLQFVHANFDPALCRNVYYIAVEECPWLKALYIDAAIYIPAELSQIQDLLIEKQLRLHVIPEELDVLRS